MKCADCGLEYPDFMEEPHRRRCGHGIPVTAAQDCYFMVNGEEVTVSPGTKGRLLEDHSFGFVVRWEGIDDPQWTDPTLVRWTR